MRVRSSFRCAVALSVLVVASVSAQAQTPPAPAPAPISETPADTPPAGDAGEVVVTGSRIKNPNATSPTPVTAVATDQLLASQPTTIGAALNNLPQLVSVGGTQANAGSQSAGHFTLNLRGIGATRTLVLMDGMRVPPTSTLNTVDTNLLPQNLISRVDIVTGGASAAYGSDAVAGVVNFILDRKFTGLKVEGSSGISEQSDNAEYRGTIAVGQNFAGDRGHILLAGEYFSNKGVEGNARKFRREGANIINNPNAPPTLITADNVRIPFTFGGLITSATGGTAANNARLVGTQFFANGGFGAFNYGTLSTSTNQVGGDGINTATLQPIARPLDRKTAFGRASFEFTPELSVYAQGFYGFTDARSYTAPYHTNTLIAYTDPTTGVTSTRAASFTIRRDNAYLPTAIQQQMTTLGITSFQLSRYDSEYRAEIVDKSYTGVGMIGMDGKIGSLDWGVNGQYGKTIEKTPIYNNPLLPRGVQAADAVRNAAGTIVCRSTLTNPNDGCVPFNPFGAGSPSAASLAYITGTNNIRTQVETRSVGADLSGPLFEGWAGPINFAAGVEYRDERARVDSNADSIAGNFLFANTKPWTGRYKVTEGFAEIDAPLARDMDLVHNWSVNGAVRRTHYSTSGSVTTWKLGSVYEPVEGLRFRVTQSRDIRAPNLTELFSSDVQDTRTVIDPFNNNARVANLRILASGNAALKPEVAKTTTVGMTVAGRGALSGFTAAIDGYQIKLKNLIAAPSAQQILDQCAQGATEFCGFIFRNGAVQTAANVNQPLTQIRNPYFNFNSLYARGVDFELGYRVARDAWVPGSLQLRGLASYLANLRTVTPGAAPVDRAGDLGSTREQGTPKWRGQATINYDVGALRTFLQMRYIGSGRYNTAPTAPTANIDKIKAAAYLDAQIAAEVRPDMEVYLNIQNLLDRDPTFVPLNSNVNVTTNANLYDQIGRMFRVGFRAKF